jgi:DNA-directed RNA polymerase specialized sigma24 family protein
VRALVDALTPVIHARVARALARRTGQSGRRDVRQELEDMTQEVFVSLFENGGKALKAWDPTRGLTLESFVGFLAERQVSCILRSGKRSPWTEDPTLDEDLERPGMATESAEPQVASREMLSLLLERLRSELSPRGMQLFFLLMVEQRPIEEIGRETQMTADALYAWRSRLGKLVRKLAAELQGETPVGARA